MNAVVDAMSHAGVRHIDMPMTSDRVWAKLSEAGLTIDPADRLGAAGASADD